MPCTSVPSPLSPHRLVARTTLAVAATLLSLGLMSNAAAQSFPNRPIRVVVPYGPGTGADFVARQVTRKMSEILGQEIAVENRPGAGAIIGTNIVAKAAPDGYTLLLGATQTAINPTLYSKLPYNTLNDLAPVARISSQPLMLVISSTIPAKTIPELIAYAKSKPGQPNYSSTGSGTINHLVGSFFNYLAGVSMTHIAYTSAPQMVVDLMRGEVGAVFYPYVGLKNQIDSGQLRMLATTSAERLQLYPQIPTMVELGYADFVLPAWQGIFAPAQTPKPVIDILYNAIAKSLADPAVISSFTGSGNDVKLETPEEFARFLGGQIELYSKIVKISGTKAD